jgi:small GTP-binding protein
VPTDFITKYHKQFNNNKYQLWDTSGQEKYSSLLPSYCRNSNGFVAVYDITNKYSFEKLKHFIECARKESNVPVIVVGNKCELEENRKVSKSEAQAYADENDFLFIETSAKCDINVNIAFELFAKHVSGKVRPKSSIKTETCVHRSPRSLTSRSQFIDANSNSLILGDNQLFTSRSLDVDLRKVVSEVKINTFLSVVT